MLYIFFHSQASEGRKKAMNGKVGERGKSQMLFEIGAIAERTTYLEKNLNREVKKNSLACS